MKKIRSLVFLLLLFITSSVSAQNKQITGKVINKETGAPLEGLSIVAEKSTQGVVTKADGTFSITVKASTTTLLFSYVGFETQTVTIGKSNVINVSMNSSIGESSEVVVIGYGAQKRSNVTGAVSKYKNERLDEAPVARLDQALQGKIAGVQIQNISSEAGAAPKINIRGISSINAGGSPLVVVDGQPVPDGLQYINMADVESVEVLKDAASAAIYGSRGASGVILITTKSGKLGKTNYRFKYSIGNKNAYKQYDIMTTSEYVSMLFKEGQMKKTDPSITPPSITGIATEPERASYIIEQALMGGAEDYQDLALKTGIFRNIELSASGGKEGIKYFVSGGYQNEEGMMIKSGFERFNLRTKMDIAFSKKVKLTLNVNPSFDVKTSPSENFTNFARFPTFLNVYHTEKSAAFVRQNSQYASIQAGDYAQPRHFSSLRYEGLMPDGSYWKSARTVSPFGSSQNNPYSSVMNQDIYFKTYRLQASGDLTINLLPGLDFKTLGTVYGNAGYGLNWANRNATGDGIVSRGVYTNTSYIDLLSENTLNYTKNINKHSINALVGFTGQKTMLSSERVTGLDFPSDNIRTLNTAATVDKPGTVGTKNQIGLVSVLGRVNYGYNNKYLLSASFRTDGSSYFGPGNKWGNFPSLSLGWVASNEKFMKNLKFISKLKVRASYGVSGNNRILDFGFLDLLYAANYPLGAGTGTLVSGQATSSTIIANKDITWESTFQKNFGVDVSLFRNKVNISFDIYQSQTDKLLLQQSSMAFTGVPLFWNNIGSLENKGYEFDISTTNISNKNLKWTTSFNLSATKNKILELGKEAYLLNQGERAEVYRNNVGDPLIQYLGFKTDGVWLSQAQINEARAAGLKSSLTRVFTPGGLKLVDVNGDKVIDNNDRTIIGNPYPDFTWGLTNTINYKAFDFSFTFQGVQGGSLINGDPNYNELKRYHRAYNNNRWVSPNNPGDGKTPYSSIGFNWMLTDYVVEDASYYSLREMNLGYTLPGALAKRFKLSSLRVFMSAQNMYFKMADNYRALNPEGRSNSGRYASSLIDGYQRGSFPVPKTIIFGVDINF